MKFKIPIIPQIILDKIYNNLNMYIEDYKTQYKRYINYYDDFTLSKWVKCDFNFILSDESNINFLKTSFNNHIDKYGLEIESNSRLKQISFLFILGYFIDNYNTFLNQYTSGINLNANELYCVVGEVLRDHTKNDSDIRYLFNDNGLNTDLIIVIYCMTLISSLTYKYVYIDNDNVLLPLS